MPEKNPSAIRGLDRQRWALLRNIHCIMEKPMVVLAIVWVTLLVVELTRGLDSRLETLNWVIWGLFIADFLVQFLIAPRKVAFLRRHWLVAVSLVLPAMRILRIAAALRGISVFRSIRVLTVLTRLNRTLGALRSHFAARGFAYVMLITLIVTIVGAAGMFAFENPRSLREEGLSADRALVSYSDALWWTSMLMTTIGSEYWPRSSEGRILCLVLSLYATGVFGYVTATLATFFLGRMREEKKA